MFALERQPLETVDVRLSKDELSLLRQAVDNYIFSKDNTHSGMLELRDNIDQVSNEKDWCI